MGTVTLIERPGSSSLVSLLHRDVGYHYSMTNLFYRLRYRLEMNTAIRDLNRVIIIRVSDPHSFHQK
jgi:hypothetical protein